uniref:Protein kinase domain-containing protein n=1 Tax=Chromera velia CCMP2878 TaxID=1169474 RepID=A0A0G4H3Z4_9ALVE|eukprot:Cvel_5642.t1-p1 / transcript=Cvel_5642.t1 / gene=Cvel_5642 / organism=Chromera_velia_CCMP2878 / gene_product=hypothetical protein / transcript_product=hypothetical protein / location=Cvel_scaffold266:49215-50717(+) / protein_length=501 / sequence_SO=supercontig / SO=protein_coding / is_pseudo=false
MTNVEELKNLSVEGTREICLKGVKGPGLPEGLLFLKELRKLDCAHNKCLEDVSPFLSDLPNLDIAFFLSCSIAKVPSLSASRSLRVLSLKSNRVSGHFDCSLLPPTLEWLIMTDNQIDSISEDIHEALPRLRKVLFSGNRLTSLPEEFSSLQSLELLRLAANQIAEFPFFLFRPAAKCPLKWIALAGNPCVESPQPGGGSQRLPQYTLDQLGVTPDTPSLGGGASGNVYRGELEGQSVAVKIFRLKGKVTSDGMPRDEMAACAIACSSPGRGLVRVQALVVEGRESKEDGGGVSDEECDPVGVVFDLCSRDDGWQSLGSPPSMFSCTRDVYTEEQGHRLCTGGGPAVHQRTLRILSSVCTGVSRLHAAGFVHGDVYAHNVLTKLTEGGEGGDPDGAAVLGDLGAAFQVSPLGGGGQVEKDRTERIFLPDVRALWVLAEEILSLCGLLSASYLKEKEGGSGQSTGISPSPYDTLLQKMKVVNSAEAAAVLVEETLAQEVQSL